MNILVFICSFIILILWINIIPGKIRGFRFSSIIRTFLFYLPFILPFILPFSNVKFPSFILPTTSSGYIVAITTSIIGLIFHKKELKITLNKNFYSFLPSISLNYFLLIELSLILSSIFEEIYYRTILNTNYFLLDILITSILFVLAHYMQKETRESFNIKSYIILFLMSIGWFYSYYISGSILPAIIGHIIYNSPSLYINLMKYKKGEDTNGRRN
ncbi:CPBP family intramembrane glutamic endopeptidase [Staphylococcus hominis]|uniref:CPBP family intramembrane glutamic endopeptidase n=1 Tax=Staphylococcus hominis TaxID=1290 RepID=UPI00136F9F15|nr:CPBP family intramembrane glutamic endopeptidase [Staphylococcus hominis]NAM96353.1 CPBP family intramembrane metalloprotease [Staphylococcus hominis]